MSDSEAEALQAAVNHRALLDRLAGRAGLDETFATDAVSVLMEPPLLRERLLAYLASRFEDRQWPVEFGSVERREEQVHDKVHGRPDLVSRQTQGTQGTLWSPGSAIGTGSGPRLGARRLR